MFGLFFLVVGLAAWWTVHPATTPVGIFIWLAYQHNQSFRIRAARNDWKPGPTDDPREFAVRLAKAEDRSISRLRLLFLWTAAGVLVAIVNWIV